MCKKSTTSHLVDLRYKFNLVKRDRLVKHNLTMRAIGLGSGQAGLELQIYESRIFTTVATFSKEELISFVTFKLLLFVPFLISRKF